MIEYPKKPMPMPKISPVSIPKFQVPKISAVSTLKIQMPKIGFVARHHFIPNPIGNEILNKMRFPNISAMMPGTMMPGSKPIGRPSWSADLVNIEHHGSLFPEVSVEPDFSASFAPVDPIDDAPTDHEPTLKFGRHLTEEEWHSLLGSGELKDGDTYIKSIKVDIAAGYPIAPKSPPPLAQWMVTAILPEKSREAILGDLEERFSEDIKKFGEGRARSLYRARVVGSFLPLAWHALKQVRLLGLVEAALKIFHG